MNRPLITQLKSKKNRLKLTGRIRVAYLDAAFLSLRGYYRLTPIRFGILTAKGAWEQFWDVWEMHKEDLKGEGLSVRKEKNKWVIHYSPPKDSGIKLDESITI
ncbi:hypothetical protein F4Y93_06140 [Candidatus Poribacteria bacterium]|nr:hypothetical protein [Candidatus Poribacteria bacterium]